MIRCIGLICGILFFVLSEYAYNGGDGRILMSNTMGMRSLYFIIIYFVVHSVFDMISAMYFCRCGICLYYWCCDYVFVNFLDLYTLSLSLLELLSWLCGCDALGRELACSILYSPFYSIVIRLAAQRCLELRLFAARCGTVLVL